MVQTERAKEITELQALSKKVCFLHANLLYYRHATSAMGSACYQLWVTLLKKVGGTRNGWRELGYSLGLSQDDLDVSVHGIFL